MKRLIILIVLTPIAVVLLIGISTANAQRTNDPAAPQSGASTVLSTGYDLSWYTIDGGGGSSNGGSYSLGGSIGQADAGSLSGGSYTLNGGFWAGTSIANYTIYLPLVRR